DLRDFSHSGIDDRHLCDLNAVVESRLNIVNSEVKYKAEVAKSLGELPQVECVASQIGQVIVNFLVNAAQAIEDRGVIEISTGCEDERVWISVRDTGHGVEPQHLRHIFEPFFTTKPVGKGTGLGLSLSYGIIRRHNGDITVDSTPGEGTCFTVWLPIVQSVESKNAA
nr:PAS domain-containing sensor histidine kinase [Gammaproteobacteria bacterium]